MPVVNSILGQWPSSTSVTMGAGNQSFQKLTQGVGGMKGP